MAKDLATKLAFKNLKTQIFKHQEAVGAGGGSSTAHSSSANYSSGGSSSEGEQTAAILTIDEAVVRQCTKPRDGQRSLLYLNSFEKINTEWDQTCLSDHLSLH